MTYSWPVGAYVATLRAPMNYSPGSTVGAVIEWAPRAPGHLTEEELSQYREGRNRAFAQMAKDLGIRVAVVEC